ncbi:MAG: hypothetical protein AAGG47_17925, partial [Pseudomonadota bacterium]
SAAMLSSRRRSEPSRVMNVPVRMRQARTRRDQTESPPGLIHLGQTTRLETLDIGRMEFRGEAGVYSTEGRGILLLQDERHPSRSIPLVRLDDAFRENPRRTLNRLFEKIANPASKSVDRRLLPLMFWLDVA